MLKNLLQNKWNIFLGMVLIFLLALIREFENQLFYDPFLAFFKSDYTDLPLPKFDAIQLFFDLLLRYGLNTLISLALLFHLFRDKNMLQFSCWLYFVFFVVLIILFYGLLYLPHPNYFFLFYVRRFLIQPIFILLFIPGFYYQKQSK